MNCQYLIVPVRVDSSNCQSRESLKCFKQFGLSLVELMVAMAIGLALMLVISSLFVGSKQTYRVQENNSRVQENGRFVMESLGQNLRIAGYRDDPSANPSVAFPAATGFTSATQFVSGVEGASTADSDEINIRFTGSGTASGTDPKNNTIKDCGGNSVAGTALLTNRFYLSATSPKVLRCDSSTASGTTTYDVIDGVEDMQILYGQDTDGDKTPNRYVSASAASSNWNNIYAVRLCALISSGEDNIAPQAQRYIDCNGVTKTATDRRLRRAFSTTIYFRNKAA